jgi:drug/metabolite transporter (DMT)-like permease
VNATFLKGFTLTIVSGILWGSSYSAIKLALRDFTPYDIALYRSVLATITLVVYFWRSGQRITFPKFQDLKYLIPLSVLGTTGFWLALNLAVDLTAANIASFIIATYPLISGFFAVVFLKEKMNFLKGLGFILGIAGTYLVIIYGSTPSQNLSENHLWGDVIALLASLSWSFYMVLAKKFYNKNLFSPNYATFHTLTLAIIPLFIIMLFTSDVTAVTRASPVSIASMLWLGIACSALAFLAFNIGMKLVKMQVVAANQFVFPVVAVILSYVLLGENVRVLALAGIVLILFGIFIAQVLAERQLDKKKAMTKEESSGAIRDNGGSS